jgi:hypothetical protein
MAFSHSPLEQFSHTYIVPPGGTLRPVPLSGPRIPSKTVQNARNPAGGADMACMIDELSYHPRGFYRSRFIRFRV